MAPRTSAFREKYRVEAAERTRRLARPFAITGVIVLLYFTFQDITALNSPEFFPIRLIALVPMLLYLGLVFSPFIRRDRLLLISHVVVLSCCVLMMDGLGFLIFGAGGYREGDKMGVISGMIAGYVAIFLFAGAIRVYLPLILGVPYALLVLLLAFVRQIPMIDLSYFSNPALVIVAVMVVAFGQERLQYKEFLMRSLAQTRKVNLETDLKRIERMNADLEREVRERLEIEKQLAEQATRDSLTGVCNRRSGLEILTNLVARAERVKQTLTVGFLDVDDLKFVNDHYGHTEGDKLIRRTAEALVKHLRKSDCIIRFGGDEFLVALPDCAEGRARETLDRVLHDVRDGGKDGYEISFSYGLAELDPAHTSPKIEELIGRADARMYINKQRKKRSQT